MTNYVIGLDFGTESARGVLIEVSTGAETASQVERYPHGVLQRDPEGAPLPSGWALQDPADYLHVTELLLGRLGTAAGTGRVIGIGIDFTASTVLPTTADGTPLCALDAFRNDPHAYVKLWKHHGATPQAEAIAAHPEFPTEHTGGTTSPEWLHAKALETFMASPEVFDAADRFIEAGDWLVWQLVGHEVRSMCQAGFKAHYRDGYPDGGVLEDVAPGFGRLNRKLAVPAAVGQRAGGLVRTWATRTGLPEGAPVGVAVVDAHAAVPGLGVTAPGTLVMAMGTSTCHLALSERYQPIRGVAGVVQGGIFPRYYAYEAGQAATGDMLAWWTRTLARDGDGSELHASLAKEAALLPPGGRGLMALDWWNGSRSPLMNTNLSGVLLGARIGTTPDEVYRALLEAMAYGTRVILDLLRNAVGTVSEVRACGGLTSNRLLMQIVANVTQQEVLATSAQATARGAAIYGACAAWPDEDPADLCRQLAESDFVRFTPQKADVERYERLFRTYTEFHRLLGEERADLMSRLDAR